MSVTWTKLPALTPRQAGLRSGCLTCGPQPVTIPLTAHIAVGFGDAGVTRDGEIVWNEGAMEDVDAEPWTVNDAERAAAQDPDHDWRIYFHGALSDAVYQRHDVCTWVLVEKGQGFA